jgi:4-hydroxy-tetrahydrodipicolinate synthase
MADRALTGVFPIAPTPFGDQGDLDLASQRRVTDFLVDAGVDGICILANYSEQFVLTDAERETLTADILEHTAGRVPTIVTTSHYSSRIAAERSRRAQELGAAMVMLMPPFFGATMRVDEAGIAEYLKIVADAIDIPIMIQDAPMAGTPLSAFFLAKLATEIPNLSYFKIEVGGTASKLRELIRLAGDAVEGPFDGEEGITLLADLDAGATGTMPSALYPEALGPIVRHYLAGERDEAVRLYERYLPLINYENRQCGLRATKAVFKEGGIIASDHVRHPQGPLSAPIREGLLELCRRLDILALRWGM